MQEEVTIRLNKMFSLDYQFRLSNSAKLAPIRYLLIDPNKGITEDVVLLKSRGLNTIPVFIDVRIHTLLTDLLPKDRPVYLQGSIRIKIKQGIAFQAIFSLFNEDLLQLAIHR